MPALPTRVDTSSAAFQANREGMLARLAEIDTLLEKARAGGGEKYVARHRARGKLLPRERIELLLDRDSPFLELSAARRVTAPSTRWARQSSRAIGVVAGVECVLIAQRPDGARRGHEPLHAHEERSARMEIARSNRLPVVNLVESGGADLPTPGGDLRARAAPIFRNLTQLSAARRSRPSRSCSATPPRAAPTCPAMCDYTVMVESAARSSSAGRRS